MAYSEQELEAYWKDVNQGVQGSASDAFSESPTFSPDQSQDLQDIRQTSVMDRANAMNFADEYKQDPKQAEMFSDRLATALDTNSPIMERARTKAQEAAGGRGLMNSSMAAGAAEGAAIDRGMDIAKGDVGVDQFNVDAMNQAEELRYQTASDIAGKTQDFQNQLGGAEADYLFDVGLTDEKQQDALETQEKDYDIKQALQDSAHAQQMDTDMLQYTNERAMEMLKQESGLYATYLKSYGDIASADISAADKNAQLLKLGQQIDNAVAAADAYKDIQITGGDFAQYEIKDGTEFSSPEPATAKDVIDIYASLEPDRNLEQWEVDQWANSGQSVADIYNQLSGQVAI